MKKLLTVSLFLITSLVLYSVEQTLIINEVASTGPYEFIELYNSGNTPLELDERWSLIDSKEGIADGDKPIQIPDGTILEAGGYLVIAPYKAQLLSKAVPENIPEGVLAIESFKLGSLDEVTLRFNGTVIDTVSWETSVNTIGRDPEDPENFISGILIPTPGEKNRRDLVNQGKTLIMINEVCSKGIDFVELYNGSSADYTFTEGDWEVHDSRRVDRFTIPAGTVIKAGEYLVLYPDLLRLPLSAPKGSLASTEGSRFGFSERDTVYLRYKDVIADMTSWTMHVTSKGRYPDGADTWDDDLVMTPGRVNRD